MLSYRYKISLVLGAFALASVAFLSTLFLMQGYRELKADRIKSEQQMGALLARNISPWLTKNSLWEVYETITRFASETHEAGADEVIVLNNRQHIYVTNRPATRNLLLQRLDALGPPYDDFQRQLVQQPRASWVTEHYQYIYTVTPVILDGVVLGTVIMRVSLQPLQAHFLGLVWHALWYGALLLVLVWLSAWWLGGHMVSPLTRLRQCMSAVAQGELENVQCTLTKNQDEFGELARCFMDMLAGLRQKKLLEKEITHAERLAALGRFTAGIAHEINNPLGGMLNAINTYKHHGHDPTVASKTMDLLERGLSQIRQTVRALLVEARPEERPLSAADLDDVRTLVQADVRKKHILVTWDCPVPPHLPLPSSQVRQVLLNLVLNAIRAVEAGGRIQVSCWHEDDFLHLRVVDDGWGIPQKQRERLFEPFASAAEATGLGLWVTYQIIQQLHGRIEVGDACPRDLHGSSLASIEGGGSYQWS